MSACRSSTLGAPDGSARRGVIALVASLALLGAGPRARACDIEVGAGSIVVLNIDATVDCIIVHAGGRLYLGRTLTLTGPGPSTVDGLVGLYAPTSQLAFSTRDHAVEGSGSIAGYHEDAAISIADGITLTNAVTIRGVLQINGPGNFTNQGIVNANSNGMLLVNVSGTLNDNSSAEWRASAANAILEFGDALDDLDTALALDGDFYITSGEIQIDEMTEYTGAAPFFLTTGHLEMSDGALDVHENTQMGCAEENASITGGRIIVAAGVEFKHH